MSQFRVSEVGGGGGRGQERGVNRGEMKSESPQEQGPTDGAVPLATIGMLAFTEWGGKLLEGFGQQIDMICLNIVTESLQLLF